MGRSLSRAWHGACRGMLLLAVLIVVGAGAAPASGTPVQSVPSDTTNLSDLQTRRLFVQGLTQSYLEDYEQAVSLFERALDRAPKTPSILSALSEAEVGRDNLISAIYYARQARTHASDTAYYHVELAQLLQETNRTDEAVSAYQTLVSRFPSHTDGRLALARLLKERGETTDAIRHYEALVEASEQVRPEVYHEMIDLYRKTENEKGLERTLKALIKDSDRPLYRRLLGHLYTQQDRHEEAIAIFELLLQEAPNDPRLLSRLKMLYTETGQSERIKTLGGGRNIRTTSPDQLVARARSMYNESSPLPDSSAHAIRQMLEQALDRSPDHVRALDLLGKVHNEQGRYAPAGQAFKKALDANPRSPARWRRAASAYLKADSAHTAAALAKEGALLFPGRYDLARIEAQAHLTLNAHKKARDRFETALARLDTTTTTARERAGVHAGLARSLDHLGYPTRADSTYKAALQIDETHPAALFHYARHLADRDVQLDHALQLAKRAVEQDSSAAALGTLGWAYAQRGRPDQAVATFNQALDTGAPDAWVYERLGDLHHTLGNGPAARQYWSKALARDSARSPVKEKLQSAPQS